MTLYFASAVKCSVVSVGRLVKTSPRSCLTTQMKFNTTCEFSCPIGYQLQGPSYKLCEANGQWTDSAKFLSCKGELKLRIFLTFALPASLLRIIYGVIRVRSCTRALKAWQICLDSEVCLL